jgi:prepilin-type N-terminal cleavage/methylation domain-containing protein
MRLKAIRLNLFSLVELLIVITIIAVLISLLYPSLRKVVFISKTTSCLQNLKLFGTYTFFYGEDNYNSYPNDDLLRSSPQQWFNTGSHTDTQALLKPYIPLVKKLSPVLLKEEV